MCMCPNACYFCNVQNQRILMYCGMTHLLLICTCVAHIHLLCTRKGFVCKTLSLNFCFFFCLFHFFSGVKAVLKNVASVSQWITSSTTSGIMVLFSLITCWNMNLFLSESVLIQIKLSMLINFCHVTVQKKQRETAAVKGTSLFLSPLSDYSLTARFRKIIREIYDLRGWRASRSFSVVSFKHVVLFGYSEKTKHDRLSGSGS